MFRYADPALCPACRANVPYAAPHCPHCLLPLTGETAGRLFSTLTLADSLVTQLAAHRAVPAPAHVSATSGPATPGPTDDGPTATGLSAASVPRILLGLGATCLLVAAMVFLAVAWSALGVGGRTGVLVLLTAGAGTASGWLAHRDLRAGAEAFAAVGLGLLALDLVGAENAGWLGAIADEWFLVLAGGVVSSASLAVALLARRTPVQDLLSAQVGAVLGAGVLGAGLTALPEIDTEPALLVAVLLTGALAAIADRLDLRTTAVGACLVTGVWWLSLAGSGMVTDQFTAAHVWGDLAAWPALAAAGVAAGVAVVRGLPVALRVFAAAAAALLVAHVLTAVAYDESGTVVSLVQLAVVAACVALSMALRDPWRWVVAAPAVIAGLLLAASGSRLGGLAFETLLARDAWSSPVDVVLAKPDLAWSWPLLLPAGTAGALAAAWLVLRCLEPRWATTLLAPASVAVAVTASLVPALYGVPLWVALSAMLAVAAGMLAHGAASGRVEPTLGAAVLTPVLLGAALASDWLTGGVLLALTVGAALLSRRDDELSLAGDVVVPLAGAGLLWTGLHLADADQVWRGVPILIALGAFAVPRPAVGREVPAAVAGAVALMASVTTTTGIDQTWLAIQLTVAGVAVTLSALVNADRRRLAWAGTGLFALAQWVRLEQLGVETVEAYTLPLALVLLAVGTVRLLRGDVSSSRALGAGLGLALVPSLLQVLVEPVSLRALLLGLACLVLVLAGVAQRWSAPLVSGAVVGTLVVLREAAHAQVLPQWVVIGLVGTALTVVGVTWEQRLAELRVAGGYLRGLR